jgi:hypothetical protein
MPKKFLRNAVRGRCYKYFMVVKYDENFILIIDIYFYQSFSTLNLIQ